MRDFTLSVYRRLLSAYQQVGYTAVPYHDFVQQAPTGKVVVFRHDVDKYPENALATARVEAELSIRGTYYFRIVRESYDPETIDRIADLGHEIGYHYEDLTFHRGDHDKALQHFAETLEQFRTHYPVTTICMHGSPTSKWDNRELWRHADYRDFGILAEPYFDTDFSKVFYITDTGRSWDNAQVSVRDKVESCFDVRFRSTEQLISLLGSDQLPDQVLQNIHPQRWDDDVARWFRELILQTLKNQVKKWWLVPRSANLASRR